jgi:hypothetical protein
MTEKRDSRSDQLAHGHEAIRDIYHEAATACGDRDAEAAAVDLSIRSPNTRVRASDAAKYVELSYREKAAARR